jgi:hypothetical protein
MQFKKIGCCGFFILNVLLIAKSDILSLCSRGREEGELYNYPSIRGVSKWITLCKPRAL